MADRFFKYKQAFSSSNHYLDIGLPLLSFLQPRSMSDKHFVNKVLSLHPERFISYYEYHLDYFFKQSRSKNEEKFLKKVISVCEDEIEHFRSMAKKRSYLWDNKKKYESYIEKAENFIDRLKSRDIWGIIGSESERNQRLIQEIKILKQKLEDFVVAPQHKIKVSCIDKNHLFSLFEAIGEIPNTSVEPTDQKAMFSELPYRTWAKLVSNHFKINDEEIPLGTALNYFDSTTALREKDRIFEIKVSKRKPKNS
ncbi:hypothetical protein [Sphingobacterium sp.]|uniref:hypothetical protein n=1 Tax=Sphingobacterium sp. TaxID=341027 RepID=UPI0028B11592|nr:hypothetical protein [Sphingobacterium sp.]